MDLGVVLGMWCAVGACIDQDVALAERLLETTPHEFAPPEHRPLVELATALVKVCRAPRKRGSLSDERAKNLTRAAKEAERFRDSRYLARLAMLAAARRARAPWRTVRAWWRLYGTRVLVGLMVAWIALAFLR